VLISFWTLENWTGKYAKWLDLCDLSTPELITPISWDLDSTNYSLDLIGRKRANEAAGTSIDNSSCFPGFLYTTSSSASSKYMGQLQDNFMSYLYHRLSQFKQ